MLEEEIGLDVGNDNGNIEVQSQTKQPKDELHHTALVDVVPHLQDGIVGLIVHDLTTAGASLR